MSNEFHATFDFLAMVGFKSTHGWMQVYSVHKNFLAIQENTDELCSKHFIVRRKHVFEKIWGEIPLARAQSRKSIKSSIVITPRDEIQFRLK